jgi:hypothetical protein
MRVEMMNGGSDGGWFGSRFPDRGPLCADDDELPGLRGDDQMVRAHSASKARKAHIVRGNKIFISAGSAAGNGPNGAIPGLDSRMTSGPSGIPGDTK